MEATYNRANWIQWITFVLVILVSLGLLFFVPAKIASSTAAAVGIAVGNEIAKIPIPTAAGDISVDVPTAEEIASAVAGKIKVTGYDEILENICDEVDCYGTSIFEDDETAALVYFDSELELKDLMEDVVDLNEGDINIIIRRVKDTEVTCASEDDNEDGNYKVQKVIRVKWNDVDDDDDRIVSYFLVTGDIVDLYDEENDKDIDFTIEEVDRDYEL